MAYSKNIQKKFDLFNSLSYQQKRVEAIRLLSQLVELIDNETVYNLYYNISNTQDIPEHIYFEIYKDVVLSNEEHDEGIRQNDIAKLASINQKILQMKKIEMKERESENVDNFLEQSLADL